MRRVLSPVRAQRQSPSPTPPVDQGDVIGRLGEVGGELDWEEEESEESSAAAGHQVR